MCPSARVLALELDDDRCMLVDWRALPLAAERDPA